MTDAPPPLDALPLLFRAANLIHDAFLITTARLEQPGPQIIYVNRAFTEMTGYSASEVVGRSPRFLQGEATSRETTDRMKECLRVGKDFDGRVVNYRKDGGEYVVELRIRPICNEMGKVTHFFSLQRDVTHDEATSAHLRRLEQAVEQTHDSILMFGADGRVYFANSAYLEWSGLPMDEVLHRPVWRLPGHPEKRLDLDFARQHLSKGEPWQREYDVTVPGAGEIKSRSVFTTVSPVRGEDGAGGFVAICRDLTERNRVWSVAEAHRVADDMGQIFAFIRHELGNPLNSIKSALTVLESEDDPLSDRQSGYVSRILEEVSRLEFFLTALRSFGMHDRLRIEKLNVARVLDRFHSVYRKAADEKGVALRLRSPDDVFVMADEQALFQVLAQLVGNAFDAVAGHSEPEVTIDCRRVARRVRLSIQDNGVGVSKADLERVTKPFFTTKRDSAGLGLALVGKLLSKMGGTLRIESTPGKGTRVAVEFLQQEAPAEKGS